MRFKTLALPILATLAAVPALAADPVQERFVDQARVQAAWHNIEVNRIQWGNGTAIIHGKNRDGFDVSFTQNCKRGVLDCPPPLQYAESEKTGKTL